MSNKKRFEQLMQHAEGLRRAGDRPDYWAGYIRGLRRAHHGDAFGTSDEHTLWLSLVERHDHSSQERGAGYIDGLAALEDDIAPEAPSADAVHAFLKRHGITGSQAARMMYLSDSRQVRKYTGGANPRQMDAARWFALHAHVILSPEQIAEIETAMNDSLDVKP